MPEKGALPDMAISTPPEAALTALNDDERREYWAALALRHSAGLGVRSACLLLKHFGSAYNAVMNIPLWPEAGVPRQKADACLSNSWRDRAKPEWEAAHTLRAAIILWTDERYPALLKELPDAPALLYASGDTSLLASPMVAVVGSRQCSEAAIDFTSAAAGELSRAGVTVVSGLAFGADSCAHRAALSGPGRTIAVLPGGVDTVYPAGQRELYRRISEHGLIVSEMPPGRIPGPGAFPVRNRLISGLCLGVLVTEAVHVHSGCLLTARLAAEQGRNVYVPSPDALRGPYREGTKKLLLDGARPVFHAGDILADLLPHLKDTLKKGSPEQKKTSVPENTADLPVPENNDKALFLRESVIPSAASRQKKEAPAASAPAAPRREQKTRTALPPLTEEEETLLSLLKGGPFTQDELLYAAQEKNPAWTSASVSAVLMILEVKKLARRLSDARYEAGI